MFSTIQWIRWTYQSPGNKPNVAQRTSNVVPRSIPCKAICTFFGSIQWVHTHSYSLFFLLLVVLTRNSSMPWLHSWLKTQGGCQSTGSWTEPRPRKPSSWCKISRYKWSMPCFVKPVAYCCSLSGLGMLSRQWVNKTCHSMQAARCTWGNQLGSVLAFTLRIASHFCI